MAASLLSHVVSDLCIGKPGVRVLPRSTPIAAALATLRAGADPFLFVDADGGISDPDVAIIKIRVSDILCYVCGDGANLRDPAAAIAQPVSVLTATVGDHGVTRRVDPQTSLLDAIDVLLANNAHSMVVPLHSTRKKHHHHVVSSSSASRSSYCVLTRQDIVRHLFGSIFLFSAVAARTVASLGLVRRRDVARVVNVDDDALDAIRLLRGSGTAVAVVAYDGALVGEICPDVVGSCGDVESVSAAFAALSVGDLMTYVDCYFSPPEFLLRSIRAQLRSKGLDAMCELMDGADVDGVSALSSSSDEEPQSSPLRARRMSSSGSLRWRSTEDVAACHAGSSLVAVMAQALAHRVGYVWVVDEVSGALVGVVSCTDVLALLREHLRPVVCYADDV